MVIPATLVGFSPLLFDCPHTPMGVKSYYRDNSKKEHECPWSLLPAAWPIEGEKLQCRQNGSNLIYSTTLSKIFKSFEKIVDLTKNLVENYYSWYVNSNSAPSAAHCILMFCLQLNRNFHSFYITCSIILNVMATEPDHIPGSVRMSPWLWKIYHICM